MSCPFAQDDAAYVLGSLSPAERLDFERHLATCEDCTRSVGELAGIPGLLGRIEASVLEHPSGDEPVPDTLLPALSREVRRARRGRTRLVAGLAAALAALAALAVVLGPIVAAQLGGDGAAAPAGVEARAMSPVGEVPVRASLVLERVTWGTRLALTCSYDPALVEYELPPAVGYTLFVRTSDGRAEQVGSWVSRGGKTLHLTAATAASPDDITSVEMRTPSGRVVLKLVL